MKFIYVFKKEDRDRLLSDGYVLLKEDDSNSIYVFEIGDKLVFELTDMDFVYSDTLTF